MQTLVLKDGTRISGESFGAPVSVAGEVVFATGMVGYPESLTDPSYAGQILVLTYPLVGNYGTPSMEHETWNMKHILKNFESERIQVAGLVVSECSEQYSHHAAVRSLSDWLKSEGIPAITGVDTRALTQKLREHGTMLGELRTQKARHKKQSSWYDPSKENLVAKVSPQKPRFFKNGKKTVAILDCGMKLNILRSFLVRGVSVHHLSYDADLTKFDYDGLFISNGPGDPKMAAPAIASIRQALQRKKPLFGICLGNQLLALAAGLQTYKLPYGHRSQNQPVREIATGRCFVTSQNHGYAVKRKMPSDWVATYENINDGSVEGLRHRKLPYFSVQFHPEAAPGPTDTDYLFDEFVKML